MGVPADHVAAAAPAAPAVTGSMRRSARTLRRATWPSRSRPPAPLMMPESRYDADRHGWVAIDEHQRAAMSSAYNLRVGLMIAALSFGADSRVRRVSLHIDSIGLEEAVAEQDSAISELMSQGAAHVRTHPHLGGRAGRRQGRSEGRRRARRPPARRHILQIRRSAGSRPTPPTPPAGIRRRRTSRRSRRTSRISTRSSRT